MSMISRNACHPVGYFVFRDARGLSTVKKHVPQHVNLSPQASLAKRLRSRQRLLQLRSGQVKEAALRDEYDLGSAARTGLEPRTVDPVEQLNTSTDTSVADVAKVTPVAKQAKCANGSEEYGFKYEGPEPTTYGDWSHKGRVTDF